MFAAATTPLPPSDTAEDLMPCSSTPLDASHSANAGSSLMHAKFKWRWRQVSHRGAQSAVIRVQCLTSAQQLYIRSCIDGAERLRKRSSACCIRPNCRAPYCKTLWDSSLDVALQQTRANRRARKGLCRRKLVEGQAASPTGSGRQRSFVSGLPRRALESSQASKSPGRLAQSPPGAAGASQIEWQSSCDGAI